MEADRACAEPEDGTHQWPEIDELQPVSVRFEGPIACVDGLAVSVDEPSGALDDALPFRDARAEVERLAENRVNRYLEDCTLEQAGETITVEEQGLEAARTRFERGFEDLSYRNLYVDEHSDDAFEYVDETGERQFERWFERRFRIRKLIEHRTGASLSATRSEAMAYYEDHPEEFTFPRRYTIEFVFYNLTEDISEEDSQNLKAEARRLAEAARQDGADFAELADASDQGLRKMKSSRNRMPVKMARAVPDTEIGEVFGPLETGYGVYVCRLQEVHPAGVAPFDEIAEELFGKLSRERYDRALETLREELRATADIEILRGNLKFETD